jgi:hypothetical protein
MENHRTDSIPNDSYPVKSDRLLEGPVSEKLEQRCWAAKRDGMSLLACGDRRPAPCIRYQIVRKRKLSALEVQMLTWSTDD